MLNSSDAIENIDTVNVTGANPLNNIILGALTCDRQLGG